MILEYFASMDGKDMNLCCLLLWLLKAACAVLHVHCEDVQ